MAQARQTLTWGICIGMILLFIFPTPGICENSGMMDDRIAAIVKVLQDKKIITAEEAGQLMLEFQKDGQMPLMSDKSVNQNQDLEEAIQQNRESIADSVDQLLQRDRLNERRLDELDLFVREDMAAKQYKSAWAQKINLSGDIRLRYQKDMFDEKNGKRYDPDDQTQLVNTRQDRARYRYRARLGIKAKLADPRDVNVGKVDAELRLATGNTSDPISTNTTMGDFYNKDSFVLDRASLRWKWKPIEQKLGKMPQIALTGGRMANPFLSTDLVWDSDLNFEGLFLNLKSDTLEQNAWHCFLTLGAFPLEELKWHRSDKWLYGGQLGLVHKPFWGLNYKLAVAYYQFDNVQGAPIDDITDMQTPGWDWSVPAYRQKGNSYVRINDLSGVDLADVKTGLASDFDEFNITAEIDLDRFYPIHCILKADFVKNMGYDRDEIESLNGTLKDPALQDQTVGYQYGVLLGHPEVRNFREWNFTFFYKYLEADAVVDAFTDSDFHGGGTDAQGIILGFEFGLYKNVWLSGRYLSANEIYEYEAAPEDTQFAIDVFQFNINAKF